MSETFESEVYLDPESSSWEQLAACSGMDVNLFFDHYESDSILAETVDAVCLSCPIRKQCLQMGVDNGEHGVWGGVFLTGGRPDANRNAHKTEEVWDEIRGYI